jgi:ATP phosphoribosyltransferase regulatory subunit
LASKARQANAAADLESEMFRALLAKDVSSLHALTAALDASSRDAIRLLPELYGEASVLESARKKLPPLAEVTGALNDLQQLAAALANAGVRVSFDFAELRGYHYHSGVVFAAYATGYADAIARGGRYDQVGKAFGRSRPATGFDMDLRELARHFGAENTPAAILAPYSSDSNLLLLINELRNSGEVVKINLPGSDAHRAELHCDRELVQKNGSWQVQKISIQ